MPNIPQEITDQISQLLGQSAQVHRSENTNELSGCLQWVCDFSRADEALASVRQALVGKPFSAYKRIGAWRGIYDTDCYEIVVCPTTDQFEMLRYEMGDHGDWETFAHGLKALHHRYGIEIDGVGGHSAVEFVLKTISLPTRRCCIPREVKKRTTSTLPEAKVV